MPPPERMLYFTQAPDGYLVFAPPKSAMFVDQLHRAIEESKTWGEFRRRLPAGEYEKLFAEVFGTDPDAIAKDEYAQEPADDAEFSSDFVPGYCDGDYPPWLATRQHRYLPAEVLREFGRQESSVLNGLFWQLDPAKAELIVTRLRSLGYTVERRDDLNAEFPLIGPTRFPGMGTS
jgi:hypothetical protein